MRWYDWLIGLCTYGLWIIWKMYRNKNNKIFRKIIYIPIILFLLVMVIASINIALESESETFQRNLSYNDFKSAKEILKKNPDLLIDGEKASILLEKKIKNYQKELKEKQELERAKRVEEAKAKAKKLKIQKAEEERLKKEKAKKEEKARLKREAEARAKAKKIAKERAERTIFVDRNELNRVFTRPSRYIGKIIKFKDKINWDYVTEFSLLNDGSRNYKFYQIYKFKVRGANWSEITQPLLFMPRDIFKAIDNDFYNKTSKNFTDYLMQSNEIELITLSASDFNRLTGHEKIGKYIYPNDTVIIITKITIYNRNLGKYETRMFNY